MNKVMVSLLVSLAVILIAGTALAGANIPINDNASLNLGYRVQAQFINTDMDLDGDGKLDSYRYFKVRRGRLRLGAKVGDHMTAFLQTDASNKDMQLIDAWVNFKVNPWLQFIMGRNMAPANRQNLTSSGALMAIDRPGIAYKSLTWGTRALHTFSNTTYEFSDSQGLGGGPDAVRDNGLTIFGSNALGSSGSSHLKYYVGIYNGIQADLNAGVVSPTDTGKDSKSQRITLRAQYNLWDAESGYYNSSTYLGTKKTLGIGFSYDMQSEVAQNRDLDTGVLDPNKPLADYAYMSADVFLEHPFSSGNALTVEGGWMSLDFDDAVGFLNTQGSGFYGQAGYFIASGWQPWVEFETFDSDFPALTGEGPSYDGTVPGKYTTFRVGVTYYLEGQHANIKLGYESFKSDTPLDENASGAIEDTISTITLGFYTTY